MLDTAPVAVAPLRTELQLRDLASAEIALPTTDVEGAEDDLRGLVEWLDLTGFVRLQDGVLISPKRERSFKLRTLYQDVLKAVGELERAHKAVCLVGTYAADGNLPMFQTVKVGVYALRSRERNPAARNIRTLYAPRSVDAREVFSMASETD